MFGVGRKAYNPEIKMRNATDMLVSEDAIVGSWLCLTVPVPHYWFQLCVGILVLFSKLQLPCSLENKAANVSWTLHCPTLSGDLSASVID